VVTDSLGMQFKEYLKSVHEYPPGCSGGMSGKSSILLFLGVGCGKNDSRVIYYQGKTMKDAVL